LPYSCGPAAIKIALSHWGLNISEEALVLLSGASEAGTPIASMEHTLIQLGFEATTRSRSNFSSYKAALTAIAKYLQKGMPLIVCISYPSWKGDSHYGVLHYIDFDKKLVRLKDSMYRYGRDRILSFEKLQQVWWEPENMTAWLLVIKKPKNFKS
jgi:predicted double-glycine peptidase